MSLRHMLVPFVDSFIEGCHVRHVLHHLNKGLQQKGHAMPPCRKNRDDK